MISAIILAAGRAERMGEPKLFLPLGGKPVLQWVLESALAADLDEVICVTREFNSARRQINIVDERLFWLINYAADRGQSTSVIAGLWAANRHQRWRDVFMRRPAAGAAGAYQCADRKIRRHGSMDRRT